MTERKESSTISFFITIIFYIGIISIFNLLIYGINYLFFTTSILSSMHYIASGALILAELRYGWISIYIINNLFKDEENNLMEIKLAPLVVGEVLLLSYLVFIAFKISSANIHFILLISLLLSIISLFIMYLICYQIEKKKDFERIKNDILANQSGMPAEERLNFLVEEYGFKRSDFWQVPLIRNLIITERKNIYR